jgi:hypothetical protein
LKRAHYPHFFPGALLVLLAIFLPACSVPLAPGYTVEKENREIRFSSGATPEVHIRAEYDLRNTGNAPLQFIDVTLPSEQVYGRKNSRAEIDGHETALENLPEEYRRDSPDTWRISFAAPLGQKEKTRLAIDYDLSEPADAGWRLTIGADNFHLGSRGWAPVLQPPRHALSPNPKRPKKSTYTVQVPAGFLVSARGALKSRKNADGENVYTYELGQEDLSPFVASGKYTEVPSGWAGDAPVFWTTSPPAGDLAAAQKELQRAWDTMKTDFGPPASDAGAPLIVESANLREGYNVDDGVATGFPGGALASPALFAKGVDSREFLDEVSLALAREWFDDEIYPPDFAQISMGDGLPRYATIVMAEARDGEAGRRARVAEYLTRYDELCRAGQESPLGVVRDSDTPATKRIARTKAPLFYVALEDAYGKDQIRAGLRQMVTLMRGKEAGIDVMRSALEQSTGKDLAPIFRIWLYQKGVPADFRARYGPSAAQP